MSADELKACRDKRDKTQAQFAAWIGAPLRSYQSWEQGARTVPGWVPKMITALTNTRKRKSK